MIDRSRRVGVRLPLFIALVAACSSSEKASSQGRIDGGSSGGGQSGTGGSAAAGAPNGGDASSGSGGSAGGGGASGGGAVGSGGASSGGASPVPDAGSFAKNPRLDAIADETAIDLGVFQCEGVGGEDPDLCRRATDYGGFVYDAHHHQMLLFGGGHSTTMTDSVHAFDLGGTLEWRDLYTPTPCDSMTTQNLD